MARIRSNRVCFTVNNYELEDIDNWFHYVELNKHKIIYAVIGEEIGQNETPHLQGFIHLNIDRKKAGINFWKAELPFGKKAHFEQARGTDEQNKEYCTKSGPYYEHGEPKEDTDKYQEIFELAKTDVDAAVQRDFEFGIRYYNALKNIYEDYNKPQMQSKLLQLRPWQEQALEKLNSQSEREILFIVDEEGGKGKSVLAKHLLSGPKSWACQGGKIGDLMHCYDTTAEIAVFDMARCNNPDYYPWNFMENLKNGWFTSTKYKGGMKIFKPPKIIVFMNENPPRNKLSADRFNVLFI